MTERQEHPVEFLAELALGVLPEEESAELRDHLAGCESCSREYDEMERVTALLPYAAQEVRPSPLVRERLFQRIAADSASAVAAAEPSPPRLSVLPPPESPSRATLPLFWVLSAAAAVLIGAAGAFGFLIGANSGGDTPAPKYAALAESAARGTLAADSAQAGSARVRLVRVPGASEAFAWVEGLPPLAEGMYYKAWFIEGTTAHPSVAFTTAQGGVWLGAPQDIKEFGAMGFTVEANKDAKQPSQAPFIAVQLHSAAARHD